MHDQSDDDRTDPVEQCLNLRERAEPFAYVGRCQHDQKRRQDERAAGDPGAEQPGTNVPDVNADLNRQWSRQGLAHGQSLEVLIPGEPSPLFDEFLLHDRHECSGSTESDRAKAQEIRDELKESNACSHRDLRREMTCRMSQRITVSVASVPAAASTAERGIATTRPRQPRIPYQANNGDAKRFDPGNCSAAK